ncbi:MAG: PHP domain-containing protein [Dehalococcoidales bacterium]|nr:PHP domain-containing protein [Dehalococcoidales bacterium]
MSKVDLHVHSTASDGRLSPEQVVRKAVENGLTVIALCDHDTVDGIPPALETAGSFPSFTLIPGVEINTDVGEGEAHILGYFIDYHHPDLLANLANLRESRVGRAHRMIAKLNNLGFKISWERVKEIAGDGSIGRPHIAQALLEKGYINSFQEAFNKYIGWGCPAYAEREKIAPAEAVRLILLAGGLPVLAHPFTLKNPETMIAELKSHGLVGIEAHYNGYAPGDILKLLGWADKYGLIATGGTDYHGLNTGNEVEIGGVDVPIESAERLIALTKQRHLPSATP